MQACLITIIQEQPNVLCFPFKKLVELVQLFASKSLLQRVHKSETARQLSSTLSAATCQLAVHKTDTTLNARIWSRRSVKCFRNASVLSHFGISRAVQREAAKAAIPNPTKRFTSPKVLIRNKSRNVNEMFSRKTEPRVHTWKCT